MFGYLSGDGTTSRIVKNVGLIGGSIDGYMDVGGVVGVLHYGTVENCYSTGDVSGFVSVGGLGCANGG